MTYEEVKILLEKYWEGQSSLAEEQRLKQYFATETVDARLRAEAPFFAALRAERAVQLPESQAVAPLRATWGGKIYRYAAAASVAILLTGAGWWFFKNRPIEQPNQANANTEKLYQDTFDDPQKAAEEIRRALALVSKKMRKGQDEATKGVRKIKVVQPYLITPTQLNN